MTAQAQYELTEILAPMLGTVNQRQAFVVAAFGLTSPIIPRLNFDVSAHTFILNLCQTIAPDTTLLDALLDEAKRSHGVDVGTRIDVLRPALHLWLRGGAVDKDAPKTSVFISYARADDDPDYDDASKSFLRRLYNALTEAGFNVWWDREKLPSRGLHFTKEIEDAIRACERFVLVVGRGALLSDYVRAEWTFALSECKPITPILRVGEYKLIPPELSDINAIDFRPTRNEIAAIADLVARLREQAPLGALHRVKPVPKEHIKREEIYNQTSIALTADQIASEANNIVIIHGVGGVGKSSLAAALAHDCQVRRMFRDGIIWLDIGQNPNIQTRQSDLGVALGDKRENYADDAESCATRLSGLFNKNKTAALIVLDDVWDHQALEYFPVQDTACRLLVTTRNAALAEPVSGLAIRLNMLTPNEGAALIRGRAGAGDENLYRQISTALGGHTLAVTLAAMRLKKKGAAYAQTILLGLQDTHDPFANLNVDQNNKNFNLSKSLEQSLALLDDDMKRRFWALGILPADSTFDIALLAALWGDTGIAAADRPAEDLIDAGLLEGSDNGRMSVHRVLRAYAAALAEKSDEETGKSFVDDSRDLLLDHVLDRMQLFESIPPYEWEEKLGFGFEYIHWAGNLFYDEFLDLVEYSSIELDVSEMAVPDFDVNEIGDRTRFSASIDPEDLTFIVNIWQKGFTTYVVNYGGGDDGRNWLRTGLIATRLLDENVPYRLFNEGMYLKSLGGWYAHYGFQTLALEYLIKAASIFSITDNQIEEATALMMIAQIKHMIGQPDEAKNAYERAIELLGTTTALPAQAVALHFLGTMYSTITQRDKAKPYLEQALALARQAHDQESEARTLRELGKLESGSGNQELALSHLEESLEIWTRLDKQDQIARVLCDFGSVHLENNQIDLATKNYDQAMRIARQLGDNGTLLSVLTAVSDYYLSRDQIAQAIKTLTEAVEVGNRDGLAYVMPQSILTVLIVYHPDLGDKTTALAQFEVALDKAEAAGWTYIASQPIEQFRFLIPLWRSGKVASKDDVEALSNNFGFALGAAVRDFIDSPESERIQNILERHSALLLPEADGLFQIFAASLRFKGFGEAVGITEKYYRLLRANAESTVGEACKNKGISAAQRQRDLAKFLIANTGQQAESDPRSAPYLSLRSWANHLLGDLAKALDDIERALVHDPNNVRHHVDRAALLNDSGRFAEAFDASSTALNLNPSELEAYVQRAYSRTMRFADTNNGDDLEQAYSDIQTAVGAGYNEPNAYVVLALILYEQEDISGAIANIDHAIGLMPEGNETAEAYSLKAKMLAEAEEYEQALSAINNVIGTDSESPDSFGLRGEILRYLQRYSESLDDLNIALESNPNETQSRFNRAMVYRHFEKYEQALADLLFCTQFAPSDPFYRFWQGRTHYDLKSYVAALDDFSHCIELEPYDINNYDWRVATFKQLDRHQDAAEDCVTAATIDPDDPRWYREQGLLHQTLENHDQALNDFEHAIVLGSEPDPVSISGRALSLFQLGRYQESILSYEQFLGFTELAETRTFSLVRSIVPVVYSVLGINTKAIEIYRQMENDYLTDSVYFANRGAAYRELGNIQQALRDYSEAIRLEPQSGDHYYWRALICIELHEFGRAEADFAKSLELDTSTRNANSITIWQGVVQWIEVDDRGTVPSWKHTLARLVPRGEIAALPNADVLWKQILSSLREEIPTRPGSIALVHLLLGEADQARYAYTQLMETFKPAEYITTHRCYLRMLNTLIPKRKDIAEVRQWFLETSSTKLK